MKTPKDIQTNIPTTVYLVYKTDVHHSYASRDLIALATSKNMAIKLCREQVKKENCKISEHDLFNLNNIMQTQGYEGEGELQFEGVAVGKLL